MALQDTTQASTGIWGAIKGALNIFSGLNKAGSAEKDNFNPTPIDEFESDFTELEVNQLVRGWKERYEKYFNDIEPGQKLSFEYWLGKQRTEDADSVVGTVPLVDNKIFEAVETFIPIATRSNPDPVVKADPGEQGQKLAASIKTILVYEADKQKLKKKLKRMIRHWLIYKVAVIKCSYNTLLDRIETEVINPKRMIFDVDGHMDEAGKFTGQYIGERKQVSAGKLMELFPKKKMEITLRSAEKKGTKLEYIEWWYQGKDVFYTMDELVLGKYKNPHWNYDIEPKTDEVTGLTAQAEEGKNFLDEATDPYTFLSIFSTGLQPHDETSLILQNVPLQDLVNRRMRQIDKNVDSMNNGMAVNNAFTAEQASQAASALRRGQAIRVPQGKVTDAIMRFPAPGIPADVYNNLKDARNELSNIFGTSGSTPQGQKSEETARGKIMINQLDASRIGGGITEYLEQIADTVYNYWVQLMFVHYTEPHDFVSVGADGQQNIMQIKNTDFLLTKTLDITVKDGSLIPKDAMTQRNEAIDLWSAGAIDPRSLFKKLDFADPDQATDQLILWQMLQKGQIQPQQYLPSFSIAQAPQVAGMVQPGGVPGVQTPPGMAPDGVGGAAVNPMGPATPGQAPAPATNDAVALQSKQLLQSVPVK